MPSIPCQYTGCNYVAENDSTEIAIALLNSHNGIHLQRPTQVMDMSKVPKVDRPELIQDITEEDWESFKDEWNRFKRSWHYAGMAEKTVADQLIECCNQDLRRLLIKEDPTVLEKSESDMLEAMHKMAVIHVASSVRRAKLLASQQEPGQTFREFYANTRAAAATCTYRVKCPRQCCVDHPPIDYAQEVVKDILLAGMLDTDIKKDILSLTDLDDKSARDIVGIVEEKETARNACSDASGTAAGISSYRKRSKQNVTSNKPSDEAHDKLSILGKCEQCGNQMPLFAKGFRGRVNKEPFKACYKCYKKNKSKTGTTSSSQNSALGVDSFIGALSHNRDVPAKIGKKVINLEHHVFSDGGWKEAGMFNHPKLKLEVVAQQEDYDALGVPYPNIPPVHVDIEVVADSGAQSCLWSRKGFLAAGFKMSDLISVNHKLSAANKSSIPIDGAIILRLRGCNVKGKQREAAVMVYISPSSPAFFMSKEAMLQLGVIDESFPAVGGESQSSNVAAATPSGKDGCKVAECGCLKRTAPPGRPKELPFESKIENRESMKQWLLDRYASSTFNQCPHQRLPCMEGPPIKLHVSPDAVPVNVGGKYATIPAHWMKQVKEDLDRDVNLHVLEHPPHGQPTPWVHRMVITRKQNGKPRRTVDLSPLNKHCIREVHPSKAPFHLAHSVPQNTFKTVMDAWNGYHSVPIREEDRHYTTFVTPFGMYRYVRAPQGFLSSGDGYGRRFDELTTGVERLLRCVDDCLLHDDGMEEHWWRVIDFLEVAGKGGVVMNREKFQFAEDAVNFAGFRITDESVEPLPEYLETIRDYPSPTNITDIRSWFGLVNQVAHYSQLREMMDPFRKFLSPKVPFEWNAGLEDVFQQSKKRIVEAIKEGVKIFDPTRRTALVTDWCKTGIGFWLAQQQCNCKSSSPGCCEYGWHIVLAGSRHLNPTERNYAPIEGEALAVAWSLQQTHYFTMGCDNLLVVVDHRPLVAIFRDRRLDEIHNPRLQRLKQRTLQWYFDIEYQPGRTNHFADAASRHPNGFEDEDAPPTKAEAMEDTIVAAVMDDLGKFCAVTNELVVEETKKDPTLNAVQKEILTGWKSKLEDAAEEVAKYWPFRNDLSLGNGLVLYKDRIIIPLSLRHRVLQNLHSAHQGISSMTARAQVTVFWPGITADIEHTRDLCRACNRNAPSQVRPPPFMQKIPKMPFEMIVADYGEYRGKKYLIIGDRLSGWTEVMKVQCGGESSGAKGLCRALRTTFATFGVPEDLTSDGGPEFTSKETEEFLKSWGVKHQVSSAYFPQGNGRAELAVKATKRLLEDNIDSFGNLDTDKMVCALLQQRNTPDKDCKLSPAQVLFGHPLRDSMPQLSSKPIFESPIVHTRWHQGWQAKEESMRSRLVHSCEELEPRSRMLPELAVGDMVFIQNQNRSSKAAGKWDKQGIIVEVKNYDQYVVRVVGSQRITLRNRRFLRKFKERPFFITEPTPCYSRREPDGGRSNLPDSTLVDPCENNSSTDNLHEPNQAMDRQDEEEVTPADSSLLDARAGNDESGDVVVSGDRLPLMLKNLRSYNTLGKSETTAADHRDLGSEMVQDDGSGVRRSQRVKLKRQGYEASCR